MPDLYGKFDIDGGTMYAYMPSSNEERTEWTIKYVKDEETVFVDRVDMTYAPIFGPDAGDVVSLNVRIEELIKKYNLE